MPSKPTKTNALRLLDKAKIAYETRTYEVDENDLSGEHVAAQLGQDPAAVFKTLVLLGDRTGHLVACIPVAKTIDLKALARASGNKSVEMIHVKDLFALTGYVRGGCSPLGMKKKFPVFFDASALVLPRITLSAGQRGLQMIVETRDLLAVTGASCAKLTEAAAPAPDGGAW